MQTDIKIGTGFDVHRLAYDNALWLGGIEIPFEKGCVAHSDGDVLLHAICDALLGALALGDIGTRFPDNDIRYKNISSLVLLEKTYSFIIQRGYNVSNLDTTLMLQEPKVSSFIPKMRKAIAQVLKTDVENISIKATTTEGLGFVGTGEGVAAQAVVLLERNGADDE